jgi:hypothetical protein
MSIRPYFGRSGMDRTARTKFNTGHFVPDQKSYNGSAFIGLTRQNSITFSVINPGDLSLTRYSAGNRARKVVFSS